MKPLGGESSLLGRRAFTFGEASTASAIQAPLVDPWQCFFRPTSPIPTHTLPGATAAQAPQVGQKSNAEGAPFVDGWKAYARLILVHPVPAAWYK